MSEKIVEIKIFTPDIYKFICRLTNQLSPDREAPSETTVRQILDSDNSHLLVLYDENETPAAMITIGFYRSPTGFKAWIEDVVVDDIFRGKGYGKKIMASAIDLCRNIGVGTISLTSRPSRIAANRLYQTLGFEAYETNVYKMKTGVNN